MPSALRLSLKLRLEERPSKGKSLDIDPFAYLRDILSRINDHSNKHLDELLPDKWRDARKAAPWEPTPAESPSE